MISVDYSLFRMQLDDCSVAYSDLFSVDHVLQDDLHWLPVKQRIIFKVGVFGYKAIHGLAPPYFIVLVSSVPAFSRNRSASVGT